MDKYLPVITGAGDLLGAVGTALGMLLLGKPLLRMVQLIVSFKSG